MQFKKLRYLVFSQFAFSWAKKADLHISDKKVTAKSNFLQWNKDTLNDQIMFCLYFSLWIFQRQYKTKKEKKYSWYLVKTEPFAYTVVTQAKLPLPQLNWAKSLVRIYLIIWDDNTCYLRNVSAAVRDERRTQRCRVKFTHFLLFMLMSTWCDWGIWTRNAKAEGSDHKMPKTRDLNTKCQRPGIWTRNAKLFSA